MTAQNNPGNTTDGDSDGAVARENLARLEAEIVERAKTDFSAFAELYEKYFPKLYNYAFSIMRQHELAEDVVSLTFEKAISKLSTYEYRGFTFGAWLYRIARNVALDEIERLKKVTLIADYPVIDITPDSTAAEAEQRLEQEGLWQALQELEADYREIVVLRYIEGYSIKETAAILERSEDAVKSIAKRALKKLRLRLEV